MEHCAEEIGNGEKLYITRYCLDLDIKVTSTEICKHADGNFTSRLNAGLTRA